MEKKESFFDRVYRAVCMIPRGKVATYGQIAMICGSPRASRVVGYALHHNPRPGERPCHRVVNRVGRPAPEFAFGGPEIQRELLRGEGVSFDEQGNVIMKEHQWQNGIIDI